MTTLLYLAWLSLRGRVVSWLRLMKQPKYLVGTLAGVTWMGMFALRPVMRANQRAGLAGRFEEIAEWLPAVETAAALMLLVFLSLWWLWPFGKAMVELTETELHLLLPAPVRRRHIIQYAVLRNQWGILFGCLMISFFSAGAGPTAFAWRFLSVWLFLTLWNLHARGRGLWIARLAELPAATAWRRRAMVLAVVGLIWAALMPAIASIAAELPALSGDVAPRLRAALDPERLGTEAPLLALLLTPARWVTGPFSAGLTPDTAPADRLATLIWPLLLVVLHNEWVVGSQARFEEASLERSRRQAASREAGARFRKVRHSRRTTTPFRLRPVGRPETAIIWKNLMLAHRGNLFVSVASGVVAVAVLATGVAKTGLPDWLIAIMTVGGFIGLSMAPLMAGHQWRNDLRTDLLRIEMIRTWPIDGWRLFASQALAPTIIATLYAAAAGGVLLIGGIAAGHPTATGSVLVPPELATRLGVSYTALLLLGLATLLPLVAAIASLSATLQNLLALLWPSWIQLGRRRGGSAANMGQGLLTGIGMMLALALGLLPGAALVGVWLFVQIQMADMPLSAWELPLMGLTTVAPLAVIIGLLTRFGGVLWDRLDPSAEILGSSGPT